MKVKITVTAATGQQSVDTFDLSKEDDVTKAVEIVFIAFRTLNPGVSLMDSTTRIEHA